MRRALLALLFLAAPAAAAASPACEASWLDSYAREWDYPKDRWLADCRADIDPAPGLRRAQSDFMAACKERFHRPDAGPASVQAEIYCALGKPGRAKLYAIAGLPDESAPRPAPKAADASHGTAPPPGAGGFGPLMRALREARARWKPDACFAGLEYVYSATPVTTDDEWKRAYRAHEDPTYSMSFVEEYDFAFKSAEIKLGGYRVAYGDHVDTATCTDLKRDLGPDSNGYPHVDFYAHCLSAVKLDVTKALAAAFPQPLPVDRMTAMLGTLTPAFLSGPGCEVGETGRDLDRKCADVPGWDARSLRAALGREVWALVINERTDFVDAASGKRLGWARGRLRARDFSASGLYGRSCPIPVIGVH
ncbi:MAG: hypothetical protein HY079_15280 [Elusimicrobia bacterium]|nr:hypothetical protein [Elusimicrobiota bacterium]